MSSSDFVAQDSIEVDSSDYEEDEDFDEQDYYRNTGEDEGMASDKEEDPEHFHYTITDSVKAEEMFGQLVSKASQSMKVSKSAARILLIGHQWDLDKLLERYRIDPIGLLVQFDIRPQKLTRSLFLHMFHPRKPDHRLTDIRCYVQSTLPQYCPVCFQRVTKTSMTNLPCGHYFCDDCWTQHFVTQLQLGVASGMECMDCKLRIGEEMILGTLKSESDKEKFSKFLLNDEVKSHPLLRWCPGNNCGFVVKVEESKAKRVSCTNCSTDFCFACGGNYHAPTDCSTIKRWLTKCEDDSETANYITAHTKDCPKCGICIEKNGGCNHMQCYKCKHDFCWMCLGDWKNHGSEYYECSRYKSNPNITHESKGIQAREALKKYLFYFERWQNHMDSLKREDDTRKKINQKIHEKVNNNVGTWIDWQYLLNAGSLLAKCRYTLMYTYPYAYYMEDGRKKLFEYQQAQLELEIENLSWKLERDESYSRGDFENQMDIAEKRRQTLLKDFLVL